MSPSCLPTTGSHLPSIVAARAEVTGPNSFVQIAHVAPFCTGALIRFTIAPADRLG